MEITKAMRKEIETDIERCRSFSTVEGSEKLIRQIIAKYSYLDPGFAQAVCPIGKATVPGYACDYRNELVSAAERLKGFLLSESSDDKGREFCELVDQISDVEAEFYESFGGIEVIYESKKFVTWREKVKYELRKMVQDETVMELMSELDQFNGWNDIKLFASVAEKCRILRENIDRYLSSVTTQETRPSGKKVFIVHGHDQEAKITVARTIEQLDLEAVILHEQPDEGKTIIEKLETYTADAAFAIVLYTECDLGRAKKQKEADNQYRARQNVVFEHGLFIGAIGRKHVCALVKGKVEKPGDIDGVVYIDMDDAGAWKIQLCKNMKAAGLDVDMNKLL